MSGMGSAFGEVFEGFREAMTRAGRAIQGPQVTAPRGSAEWLEQVTDREQWRGQRYVRRAAAQHRRELGLRD